jgi:hypothetical protein
MSNALILLNAGVLGLGSTAMAQEIPALQQGMSYGEARQMLIAAGWQANLISPMARESISVVVQDLLDRGYSEVQDCAGTGQGLCRFEFATAEGQKLVVITQPTEADPVLYRWWLEETP